MRLRSNLRSCCFLTLIAISITLLRLYLQNNSEYETLYNEEKSMHNLIREKNRDQKIYMSLTTISGRGNTIGITIDSIIKGSIQPDEIYIYISSNPYLLDEGLTKESLFIQSPKLKELVENHSYIHIKITDNIGPHRKLLPLLREKWNEDCIIVTIDDDRYYDKYLLQTLLLGYEASGRNSIISARARRIGICTSNKESLQSTHTIPYSSPSGHILWPEAPVNVKEMLILPIGIGGVLYRPKFFHPIVFDSKLWQLSRNADDLMFRLATMANNVNVGTVCVPVLSDKVPVLCPKLTFQQMKIRYKLNNLIDNSFQFNQNNITNIDAIINQLSNINSINKNKCEQHQDLMMESVVSITSNNNNNNNNNNNTLNKSNLRNSNVHDLRGVSLFRVFNGEKGGNINSFRNSVCYLLSKNILDFTDFVKKYKRIERKKCFFTHDKSLYNNSTNFLSNIYTKIEYVIQDTKVLIQNLIDNL